MCARARLPRRPGVALGIELRALDAALDLLALMGADDRERRLEVLHAADHAVQQGDGLCDVRRDHASVCLNVTTTPISVLSMVSISNSRPVWSVMMSCCCTVPGSTGRKPKYSAI